MLPEKWCIELTKENIHIVGKYYDNKCNSTCYADGQFLGNYLASHNFANYGIIEGVNGKCNASYKRITLLEEFPEISTEEFIELAGLNISFETPIEASIPLIFN